MPELKSQKQLMQVQCQMAFLLLQEAKPLSSVTYYKLQYTKPDIVCGTESWLSSDIKSSEVFPVNTLQHFSER